MSRHEPHVSTGATWDVDLRQLLHYAPVGADDPPSTAALRRGAAGTPWIEVAAVNHAARVLCLRLATHTTHAFADVFVDADTRLVFLGPSCDAPEPREFAPLHAALERVNDAVAAAGHQPPSLLALAALLLKHARPLASGPPCAGIPPSVTTRPWIQRAALDAAVALSSHPAAAAHGSGAAAAAAVSYGLSAHVALLTAAAHAARRHLVCAPLPTWLAEETASAGATMHAGRGELGTLRGVRTGELAAALGGLPRRTPLALESAPFWAALPSESLLLLYWLLALAPVRLIADHDAGDGGARARGRRRAAAFTLVHGCLPLSWRADAAAVSAPPWDATAAATHGLYVMRPGGPPLPLFHGSAPENAYSIASNGLRSLSGTRHEASGSIFGAGVYVTNDAGTASEFTRGGGTTWAGFAVRRPPFGRAEHVDLDPPLAGRRRDDGGGTYAAPLRWRAVFQCTVVAAPLNRTVSGGASGAATAVTGGAVLRAGSYVVVRDQAHVLATRLILEDDGGGDVGGAPQAAPATLQAPVAPVDAAHAAGVRWALWAALPVAVAALGYYLVWGDV